MGDDLPSQVRVPRALMNVTSWPSMSPSSLGLVEVCLDDLPSVELNG